METYDSISFPPATWATTLIMEENHAHQQMHLKMATM